MRLAARSRGRLDDVRDAPDAEGIVIDFLQRGHDFTSQIRVEPRLVEKGGDGHAQHLLLMAHHARRGQLHIDCQVQRYYALMVRAPMVPTHADGACEEINGCSGRMMMHRYA